MAFLAQASYYDILGVSPRATAAEIHDAYRKRMSELPAPAWRRFLIQAWTGTCRRTLLDARETLTCPVSRAAYDATLRCPYFWIPFH